MSVNVWAFSWRVSVLIDRLFSKSAANPFQGKYPVKVAAVTAKGDCGHFVSVIVANAGKLQAKVWQTISKEARALRKVLFITESLPALCQNFVFPCYPRHVVGMSPPYKC